MIYFITPVTSQTLTFGQQSVTTLAPKYISLLTGLTFTVVNFGEDGWGILTLAAALPSLSANSDVYTFPANLAATMAAADVSALSAFLATANIPSDQIIAGQTFAEALQIIAKICMVNQALCGAAGAPMFSTGVTLSTTIADSDLAPLASAQAAPQGTSLGAAQVGVGAPGGGSGGSNQTIPSVIGPFDFSNVTASTTIGQMLDAVSQQFTQPVNLGEF